MWSHQLTDLYAWQRPEHGKVLAWLMVAIFVGKDVCLDRLGLNLPRAAKPESIGQQFRRWLKNDHLDARVIYDPVARRLVSQMRGCRLRIQIDRVQLKKRHNILMLSLHYRRRAIPLVWQCLSHSGSSHDRDWQALLAYLHTLLQPDQSVIILADREFGHIARLRCVTQHGWSYAIRLKSSLAFYDRAWGLSFEWLTLAQIAPARGTRYALLDIALTKGGLWFTHLACAWAVGSDDPWFIATNLAQPIQALKEYARRFGCEELFSDLKKRGFQWENSMLRDAGRMSRLLLVLALLTVFLVMLGRHVRRQGLDREIASPSHCRRLSLFQMARRWLQRRLAQDRLPEWLTWYPLGQLT